MTDAADLLLVVASASYKGAVGFADIFECQIHKVLAGSVDEPAIRLTVLPGDKEILQFLSAHLDSDEIEIAFKLNEKNEPDRLLPITGFVDKNMTSWTVESIRAARA